MVDDTARDRAIYHALKAADEVAAALQAHLLEEHGADPERAAPQSPATNALKLLRQARERLGQGLRAVKADHIAESDEISLRNQPRQSQELDVPLRHHDRLFPNRDSCVRSAA
ncbi:MAG TPA: hypothetical protein VFB06_26205 [Streptosporangiaceae bacterium]|nr:hypothetical protein [Streptosporangiaceae bacterium]